MKQFNNKKVSLVGCLMRWLEVKETEPTEVFVQFQLYKLNKSNAV